MDQPMITTPWIAVLGWIGGLLGCLCTGPVTALEAFQMGLVGLVWWFCFELFERFLRWAQAGM